MEKKKDRVDPFVLSKKLQWFLFKKATRNRNAGEEKGKKRNGEKGEN